MRNKQQASIENLKMALSLNPDTDLIFKGPFNIVSTTALKLGNQGNERLAYKIKTTAPKRYCVKPNSGFLDPKQSVQIQVMLQPHTAGQPDDRNKHKFMVQWVTVPDGFGDDVDSFWKQDIKGMNVHDAKLKCVFVEDQPTLSSTDNQPVLPSHVELTNTSENRAPPQQTFTSVTSRSSPPSVQPISVAPSSNPTRSQVPADDNDSSQFKKENDRLKNENESLKDRLKQQEVTLRQRSTAGDRAGVINATDSSKLYRQQSGLLVLGIQFNEQLVLIAIVIALLFGFSLGYFLFSCGN